MKVTYSKNHKAGVAMTEYMIILAVVALGCIGIFGTFGKEVKYTVARIIATLENKAATDPGAVETANTQAAKANGMGDFVGAGN